MVPSTTKSSSSQPSESSVPSPSRTEWNSDDERDWDDYNYVPPAHSDPFAALLDGLSGDSGLDADAIAAMIRDLPVPNAVEVPGLTVDEAIAYDVACNILWYIPCFVT